MKTRNIREVKVGDIVVDHFGDEGTVMEVLSNTFAVLDVVNEPTMDCKWFTFKSAEDKGWVILPKIDRTKLVEYVGVDDSEEVFTKEELDGLFALTIGHLNAFSNPDVSDTLFWRTIINKLKLNKMLKEKE